jgi:glucokinase
LRQVLLKHYDPKQYVKALRQAVHERYAHDNVDVIVIAIPGVIDNGVVKWCGNLPWRNINFSEKLKDLLPGVPVLIENDAKLAALGETRALPSIPFSSLYVTISTGIGGGLVVNGNLDQGMRFSEIGRIPLEYDGKIRIWESFASGHAIVKVYKKFARDITSERTWRQIADRMSRGFLVVIPTIQPNVIIIGGSVGSYFDRYGKKLEGILKEHLPDHIPCPKIVQAPHPVALRGCARDGHRPRA